MGFFNKLERLLETITNQWTLDYCGQNKTVKNPKMGMATIPAIHGDLGDGL